SAGTGSLEHLGRAIIDRRRRAGAPSAECLFDLPWKGQRRVYPRAVEVAAGQPEHGDRSVWRRNPTGAAVEGRGAVAVERMDDRGSLTRSFGKDFNGALVPLGPISSTVSFRDEAGETGQPRRPTDRLYVLVENLVGRR